MCSTGVEDNGGGTITVAAGVTSFTVTAGGVGDTDEEATETYDLTVGGVTGVGSITDDDAVSISSVSSETQIEGTDPVPYTHLTLPSMRC